MKTEDTLEDYEKNNPHKVCRVCKNVFPATTEYFNKRKASKDGLEYLCKKCKAQYSKKFRAEKNEPPAPVRAEPVPSKVKPEDLYKAIRISHAEEACRAIVKEFAPGYDVELRPKQL